MLALVGIPGFCQENVQLPRELELIFNYVKESDYPELFNGDPYQVRPIRWQIIDIDGDGVTEVFLQTFPHYRQSPTITIYQIDANNKVSRITEGLAPGPLIALDPEDDYFDTHTTGTAIDMQIDNSAYEKMRALAKSTLKFGMSSVIYKNFLHSDKRDGKPVFVDLSHLEYKADNSCSNFQFSQPAAIAAGQVKGKQENYFMAVVGNEIYCYAIKGFTADGWLDKTVSILKKPSDFKEFVIDKGQVKYMTQKGGSKDLKI